jgi:hypothetical protein
MANERIAWQQTNALFSSTGNMGSFANDAWQIAGTFDTSKLPQGASQRLAVFVQFTIRNVSTSGPGAPSTGAVEVALGLDSGLRGATHRCVEAINTLGVVGPSAGKRRTLLMVQQQSPSISDPDFGQATSTISGANLCLWTRGTWVDDQPAYVCFYEIADIQWLVFDMDAMEAEGMVRAHVASDVTLTSSTTDILINGDATSPGATDTHLTFGASYSQPRDPAFAPGLPTMISFGMAGTYDDPTTHVERWRCGTELQNTALINSSRGNDARMCLGGMTVWSAGNQDYHQVIGRDHTPAPSTAARRTVIRYSTLLSINTGNLEGFESVQSFAAQPYGAAPGGYNPQSQTRLQNNTSLTFAIEPVILAASGREFGSGNIGLGLSSHRTRILTDTGGNLYTPDTYSILGQEEEVLDVSMVTTKIIANGSRPMRHQCEFDIGSNLLPNTLRVKPFVLCLFHHTINVDDVLSPPWTELNPVELTITAEGPLVGTMNALPIVPDVAQQVSVEGMRHGEVLGSQGYRRTWPIWVKPRKVYNLIWSTLSATQATSVMTFLDDNDSFAYTPPHGTATPVVISGPVQAYRLADGRKQVSVQVTQLIWTA